MYKQFNWRNFFLSLVFLSVVGAVVGVITVLTLGPIIGRTPAFVICGAGGVVIGMLNVVIFPWYTYPEGE